jgi:hypothetical protein
MSEDVASMICGIGFFVGIVVTLAFIWAAEGFYGNGYQQAYEDARNHKIEAVTQESYPALWIKYNAPKLPPQ